MCHDADIVYYDGVEWNVVDHKEDTKTDAWLRGVWGSEEDDVYAVGDSGTILHFDGAKWYKMNSSTLEHLYGVWGTSGENVYAVGAAGTILYYNGVIWDDALESAPSEDLRSIWGTNADDIYVAGGRGTILHYDGEDWLPMESHTDAWILGLWGTSNNNIYGVGGYFDGVVENNWLNPNYWSGGVILHYDGNSWSEIKTDIVSRLFSIWGSSDSDIYTVGAQGTILYYGDAAVEDKCLLENLYGDNPEKLTSLRHFRDDVLNTTRKGKFAVRAYYTMSPLLVTLIEQSSWLRNKLETSIDRVLPSLGVEFE